MSSNLRSLLVNTVLALGVGHTLQAASTLPEIDTQFRGKIGKTTNDSVPDWPREVQAPEGAPNIVLVLLDDVGFGSTGTFGGPAETPALDKLASEGLRYNRFHVTALCSPTRGALLTGRNHHRGGFGHVSDGATGYPGYDSVWKRNNVSLAEVLRRNGYNTAAFGKWHNTPQWEITPAGPFDRWPTGLGFEYFYGFHFGEASQFETPLYRNTVAVEPAKTIAQGYHFTTDITDDAIGWVHTHQAAAPNKPFFLYYATGAAHAPLHVPQEWVDKYKGKFDQGWDKLREETLARQKALGVIPQDALLTPRPKEIPAWDSLTADQKRLYARQAEVYSAFVAHTDYEIGRLLETVRKGPGGENTLVIYIVGDNGASAEGGLEGNNDFASFLRIPGLPFEHHLAEIDKLGGAEVDNHYNSAWAWANNAPFQWTKQVASHLGGIRDPLVVSWPARIKEHGGLRSQFTHVIDVAPTIYDLLHLNFPEEVDGVKQLPLDGKSFAASLENPKAEETHTLQYFEMVGNRGIYKDGWFAGARHSVPWDFASRTDEYDKDTWELYNLNEDYSQAKNLAAQYPEKLEELKRVWDEQAKENHVYPLAGLLNATTLTALSKPSQIKGVTDFTYYPTTPRLANTAVPVLVLSHTITAHAEIPASGAEGVLLSQGARFGGFTLYVKDGYLYYENNFLGRSRDVLKSDIKVPAGKVELAFDFTRESREIWGGGTGRLLINGEKVAEAKIAHIGPASYLGTFGVGQNFTSPVSPAYEIPFKFTGNLEKVVVHVAPLPKPKS